MLAGTRKVNSYENMSLLQLENRFTISSTPPLAPNTAPRPKKCLNKSVFRPPKHAPKSTPKNKKSCTQIILHGQIQKKGNGKIRLSVESTWYDWLISHILESVKKSRRKSFLNQKQITNPKTANQNTAGNFDERYIKYK